MAKTVRKVIPTMLIVGEGSAEVALLAHIKRLYVRRDCGLALTIHNARGKGAAHVVDVAIRQSKTYAYDHVWALLDTDTDYTSAVIAKARQKRVQLAACQPCLEAELLRACGFDPTGHTSMIKTQFERQFAQPAHREALYEQHFGASVLQDRRFQTTPLGSLIQAIWKITQPD